MKFEARINFTIDNQHPDYKYIKHPERVHTIEDVYDFDVYDPISNISGYWMPDQISDMKRYIKNDLAVVAGGGYDNHHIHNVVYSINKIN